MNAPTIVKQTKKHTLIKVAHPKRVERFLPMQKNIIMTAAEKRVWDIIQEAELDIKDGRVITAPSLAEALRRYEKKQWD